MKKMIALWLPALLLLNLSGCKKDLVTSIESPSGEIKIEVFTLADGQAAYAVQYQGKMLVDTSGLAFEFRDDPPLINGLKITETTTRKFSETWEMPWGEQRFVDSHFNELKLAFAEKEGLKRKFDLVFRVYDDGLGFRFEFPEQENMGEVFITEERTEFNLTGDHKVWWTPGDWDISEHLYSTTRFSEIDALSKRNHPNLAQTHIPVNAVNTPVTMKTDDGVYLSFHEAALINYSSMTLAIDPEKLSMTTNLVGSWRDYKVEQKTPFNTPWRMIQIADRAGDLIESKLILNLNEPSKMEDTSWLKPLKYVGIWWEMHLDISTWAMAGGRHGATTDNALRYIDFAADNGIDALLIEGWNTGWEDWIGTANREGIYDFVTPYPDYDIEAVVNYGRARGVDIIMHHETSAAVTTYEQQLDTAYALIEHLGINAVKTGYVGTIIPEGEYHHNQFMVNHYQKVIETAARHKVAVNSHESAMASGLRRTWPNKFAMENIRGQEFNAWASDGGNPPEHLTIVPFTRMLAGPIDYTPGIFNIKLGPTKPDNQVNTTLAHQLALYVVLYSPIQMAADLPENYEGHPAFQFIKDVGVDWEQTRVLDGEIGEFVTIARQERETGNWFLGSVTNEDKRNITVRTDFLEPGFTYLARIYADAPDAHWFDNPTDYKIEEMEVTSQSSLNLLLAPGGGVAISFHKKN
ncbi:MAG: glycoside hydrolase family 97 protein [Bacteroidales bacterium]|nr:glycoside hydrolase family 97 protein [Bacteroidales bacterium]